MKEDKKKIGDKARTKVKKESWCKGMIDEHYNQTDKVLEPKNTELVRTARMTRKSLAYALEGQPVKIKKALDILFEEDARSYIDAIAKLMNYAMPKLSSTEIKKDSDTKIEISLNEGATLDDIKRQIRDLDDAEDIDFIDLDDE
jgi:hypothetical protein